jgi:5-methylcytosine-specific restriction endonuclease McrA
MKLCSKGLHDLDDATVAYINSDGRRRCAPCHQPSTSAAAIRWRKHNPESAREVRRKSVAKWSARHPTHANQGSRRRRARIASVLATLTAAEWEAILEAAGRACIYCGSRNQLTQDHLMPLSRGGNHTAANVAPACLPCNLSKGAKVVAEFLAEAS